MGTTAKKPTIEELSEQIKCKMKQLNNLDDEIKDLERQKAAAIVADRSDNLKTDILISIAESIACQYYPEEYESYCDHSHRSSNRRTGESEREMRVRYLESDCDICIDATDGTITVKNKWSDVIEDCISLTVDLTV